MKLTVAIMFDLAMRIGFSATFVWLLVVILRSICRKRKVFTGFANLRIRNISVTIIAGSILLFILLAGILDALASAEITSLLESLGSCSALRVTKPSFKPDGRYIYETVTINKKGVIQELTIVLANARYKRTLAAGTIADSLNYVSINIVQNNKGAIGWFRVVDDVLEIGERRNFHRYRSSDRELPRKVRKALGLSPRYREDAPPDEEVMVVPISERKVWVGTKEEWKARQKEPNSLK